MSNPNHLATARLDLVASTLEHIECELNDPERLAEMLDVGIPQSWPPGEYDRDAMEYLRARLAEGGEVVVGWYSWYGIVRQTPRRTLVAAGGYFGPPGVGDEVEIGYSLVPEFQGHGYATELVVALVDRAFRLTDIKRVVARTTPDNRASAVLLERCGFVSDGQISDEGTVRYLLQRKRGSRETA